MCNFAVLGFLAKIWPDKSGMTLFFTNNFFDMTRNSLILICCLALAVPGARAQGEGVSSAAVAATAAGARAQVEDVSSAAVSSSVATTAVVFSAASAAVGSSVGSSSVAGEQQLVTSQWQDGKRPVYCNVMGYNFWGAGKVKVKLDMGDGRFSTLYDVDGQPLKFGTMMSVLDYMSERGWRCIGTYFIGGGNSSRVIHYLLEKWVTGAEEKSSGLVLQKADDEPYERGKNGDDLY